MSTEAERFDAEFFKLGMHYYAAARSAARSGFMPVCGTLYHHALEMFLKGRLINTYSLEQLKQKPFGHRLGNLWAAFKSDTKADLNEFDDTIIDVNEFEVLRYPDELLKKGAEMRLDWIPLTSPPTVTGVGVIQVPKYRVVVANIDRLVAAIFKVCSRNPKFFTGSMNPYAREAITYENQACEGWFADAS